MLVAVAAGLLSAHAPAQVAVAAVGVVAIALVTIAVTSQPVALALVAVATLPWEGALRFPTHTITVVKMVGLLLATAYLVHTFTGPRKIRVAPPLLAAFGVTFFVTLSMVVDGVDSTTALETSRYWSFLLFAFFLVQFLSRTDLILTAMKVLTLSATFGALWATWQFLAGTAARASGPISDPNDFAYLMAVVLPLAGMLAAREPRWRVAWLACCAALICAILASLSRGALVGLAAVGLWLVLTRKVAPSMILFAGGLMLASAIAVPTFAGHTVQTKLLVRSHGASTTGSQRLVYWDAASRMALDRPLFGFGPDRFQTAGLPYIQNPVRRDKKVDANSTWFQLAAENGIPALLVFIAFLASIWRAMNQLVRRSLAEGDRQQATVIWSLQAALIIATVSGTFFSAELSSPFWLILAFVSAYWASLRPDRPA